MSEKAYEPELGQAVFGGPWEELRTPHYVMLGLDTIADKVAMYRGVEQTLTSNSGDPEFSNDVFVMRSYCWCDGSNEGHEEGCPPNFEYRKNGVAARWYKHSERGESINRQPSRQEWHSILADCLNSIPDELCSHDREFKPHPWAADNPSFNDYWECRRCGAYGFGDHAFGETQQENP